jgi:hypothetical protein
MHVTTGRREPAAELPSTLARTTWRSVDRPTGLSRTAPSGWALAGFLELAIALVSGAVALLGDALTKLFHHGGTAHPGWGMVDAKQSWLDALSSAGAMLGLLGGAVGWGWDTVAGIVVAGFICHVGWEVTGDVAHVRTRSAAALRRHW